MRPRISACLTCSSSRSSSRQRQGSACGSNATWICLVAALGATIALTIWLELSGLPALPAIAVGFLLPNADLIWRRLRGQSGTGDRAPTAV